MVLLSLPGSEHGTLFSETLFCSCLNRARVCCIPPQLFGTFPVDHWRCAALPPPGPPRKTFPPIVQTQNKTKVSRLETKGKTRKDRCRGPSRSMLPWKRKTKSDRCYAENGKAKDERRKDRCCKRSTKDKLSTLGNERRKASHRCWQTKGERQNDPCWKRKATSKGINTESKTWNTTDWYRKRNTKKASARS